MGDLRLNTTEFLDWAEVWCFRCEHDHAFSHGEDATADGADGCEICLDAYARGESRPEIVNHEDYWRSIPAHKSCTQFTECTRCPADDEHTERRGIWGDESNLVTRNQFSALLRSETLALPVVDAKGET